MHKALWRNGLCLPAAYTLVNIFLACLESCLIHGKRKTIFLFPLPMLPSGQCRKLHNGNKKLGIFPRYQEGYFRFHLEAESFLWLSESHLKLNDGR